MKSATLSTKPWFRHAEPWLLLSAPIAAMVAGSVTWWIAASTNHSLVVDDYYKQGKAINQTLARDQRARELGLRATLTLDPMSQRATLELASDTAQVAFPEAIRIQLIHATRAELDHQVWLRRADNESWRGALAVPADGRWRIQIDDGAGQWRLLKAVTSFAAPVNLAPEPDRTDPDARTARGS